LKTLTLLACGSRLYCASYSIKNPYTKPDLRLLLELTTLLLGRIAPYMDRCLAIKQTKLLSQTNGLRVCRGAVGLRRRLAIR
jgi:hypothetical protein